MLAIGLGGYRPAVAIRAGPIDDALHHQSASHRVELGNSARSDHCAARHPAVRANGEHEQYCLADASAAEVAGIVRRVDRSGDLFGITPSSSVAIAITARAAARA